MFEQATLQNGPAGKRALTTFLGMSSQMAVVSIAMLAPMVWPQILPLARLEISLAPTVPPGPKAIGDRMPRRTAPPTRGTFVPLDRYQPVAVPKGPPVLLDEAPVGMVVPGGTFTDRTGQGDSVVDGILAGLGREVPRVPLPMVEKAAAKPVPETAPAIQRLTQGGLVKLGHTLHKAEPAYPPLAKATHTVGDVILECVVGIDGHIKEVKLKSGNPLLAQAAVDAAWQWSYEPSKLNGSPIEIVTMMTFSFKLN